MHSQNKSRRKNEREKINLKVLFTTRGSLVELCLNIHNSIYIAKMLRSFLHCVWHRKNENMLKTENQIFHSFYVTMFTLMRFNVILGHACEHYTPPFIWPTLLLLTAVKL